MKRSLAAMVFIVLMLSSLALTSVASATMPGTVVGTAVPSSGGLPLPEISMLDSLAAALILALKGTPMQTWGQALGFFFTQVLRGLHP